MPEQIENIGAGQALGFVLFMVRHHYTVILNSNIEQLRI